MAAMLGFAFVLAACGSQPSGMAAAPTGETVGGQPSQAAVPASSGSMTLDEAIAQAAAQMEERLPARTEVALISVSSPSAPFSQYVLDGIEAALVRSGKLVVVDRANLDKVRAEQGFQESGEVSDDSAKSIGQMVGAGTIVTGSLSNIGTLYRLTLKAIDVAKAVVAVSFPADITNDERVRALLSQSSIAASPRSSAPQTPTGASTAGSGTAQAPAAPVKPVVQAAPGALYVGDTLEGEMDLLDALDWISINAKSGGNYTIALGRDEAITPTELSYGGKTLTISLKSAGGEHTVSFDGANPSYSLFNVKSGVTFTLEDGVTLRGTQNGADKSLVEVTGGRFVMNGGAITGNKRNSNGSGGGGVYVASGALTMNGGTISGNTVYGISADGGGVYVQGTFTMNGGSISENACIGRNLGGSGHGGGVCVNGTFTMNNGTISGNTTGNGGTGGGVYVRGTFIMKDGVISGNTTNGSGGGVSVDSGSFTMSGGTINGNTAKGQYAGGGGVYMGLMSGKFTMSGGTISGNAASSDGGGVYASTFTKSGGGGVIYGSNAADGQGNTASGDGHAVYASGKKRNTTARAATAMDSAKDGPAGGWE
ncbi:hypothetical protein AGMMS50268_39520 [Spirochaetia bacterium]|nr:hypothetical protein AGMMS50268_39520 [Spirochaetia bacterium]